MEAYFEGCFAFSSPLFDFNNNCFADSEVIMSQLLLLGKLEYGWGPIFKVVLECLKRSSEPFLIYIYGTQCDFMPKVQNMYGKGG